MSLLLLFAPPASGGDPVIIPAAGEDTSHVFLAWGNLIDGAIISGGDWLPALPLANLKNRTLSRVARSTSLSPSATKFELDLGPAKIWRVFALKGHNFDLSARYRLRLSEVSSFAVLSYDSGWKDVWPPVYGDADLEFGDINWWEKTYSEAERQGYIWTLIHRLPNVTNARYVRLEIDDPDNQHGFVQIARPFVANGWFPSRNINVGSSLAWQDDSGVQQAYGGSEYFNEIARYRVASLILAYLDDDEAYTKAFEMMRQVGITGEVLIQWNGDDTIHALRRQFIGRLRKLSAVEHPYPMATSTAFEIKE